MDIAQFLKDYGELISITIIPFILWFIGIKFQDRKDKKSAKMQLFLTIVSQRRIIPTPIESIRALNQIDIVFQDSPEVCNKWRSYYYSLHEKSEHFQQQGHFQLELLSEMAKDLKYKNIEQTALDRFYFDASHNESQSLQNAIYQELYRTLENSENYGSPRIRKNS